MFRLQNVTLGTLIKELAQTQCENWTNYLISQMEKVWSSNFPNDEVSGGKVATTFVLRAVYLQQKERKSRAIQSSCSYTHQPLFKYYLGQNE
jgi:hypothetical protein